MSKVKIAVCTPFHGREVVAGVFIDTISVLNIDYDVTLYASVSTKADYEWIKYMCELNKLNVVISEAANEPLGAKFNINYEKAVSSDAEYFIHLGSDTLLSIEYLKSAVDTLSQLQFKGYVIPTRAKIFDMDSGIKMDYQSKIYAGRIGSGTVMSRMDQDALSRTLNGKPVASFLQRGIDQSLFDGLDAMGYRRIFAISTDRLKTQIGLLFSEHVTLVYAGEGIHTLADYRNYISNFMYLREDDWLLGFYKRIEEQYYEFIRSNKGE